MKDQRIRALGRDLLLAGALVMVVAMVMQALV